MKTRCVFGVLLVLAAGSLGRAESEETEYFALFMEGKKVGYAIQSRTVADKKVTTTEKANITMSRANVPLVINSMDTCVETIEGKPLSFESLQELAARTMRVAGTVDEQGMVNMTVASMAGQQKSTFEWPSGAVMSEGLRLILLKKGLKQGLSYTAKVFSPSIMRALDVEIYIGPKRNVDLLGRVVALTEVITTFKMPEAGEIISTLYVDDDLRMQKNIMPIAGIRVEMIACAKEFALSDNDVFEVIGKMFLPSPVPLNDVSEVDSITYYLSPTADANILTIPSTDNQSVQPGKDGVVIVTVKPVAAPAGAKFPYKGADKAILEALKPTRFVQSDNEKIIELAKQAVGDTKDAAEAVKRIEAFVGNYIENRSLSVGYASAVEVAASRQGDCSEFAVLTAAMCRAVGIPARVVAGIAYVKDFAGLQDRFAGHMWVEAYVGDKWIGIDASFKGAGLGGYDPGHIIQAIGNGNPEDFFKLVSILGKFKIDKVIVNKGK